MKTVLKLDLCHANNFAFLAFHLNAEVEVSFSRDQQRTVYGDVKCPTACPVSGTILFREILFGFCLLYIIILKCISNELFKCFFYKQLPGLARDGSLTKINKKCNS